MLAKAGSVQSLTNGQRQEGDSCRLKRVFIAFGNILWRRSFAYHSIASLNDIFPTDFQAIHKLVKTTALADRRMFGIRRQGRRGRVGGEERWMEGKVWRENRQWAWKKKEGEGSGYGANKKGGIKGIGGKKKKMQGIGNEELVV
jgi:hypothetical protein